MSQKQISQWRTVATVLLLAALMTWCLHLVADKSKGPELLAEIGWAFVIFAGVAAGKSAVEHLGKGAGLRGALSALLTETKPGEPPRPPPPPAGFVRLGTVAALALISLLMVACATSAPRPDTGRWLDAEYSQLAADQARLECQGLYVEALTAEDRATTDRWVATCGGRP